MCLLSPAVIKEKKFKEFVLFFLKQQIDVFHFVFELPDLVDPGHDGKDGGVGDERGFNSSHSQVACQLLSLVGRG